MHGAGAFVARHMFEEVRASRTAGSRVVVDCADLRAGTNTTSHSAVGNPTPHGEIAVGRAYLFFASSNFRFVANESLTTTKRLVFHSAVASLISTAAGDRA